MHPARADPDVQDVIDRELLLLDPAVRHSPSTAADLLDPDFREFGASGRIWDRVSVLDRMAADDMAATAAVDITATRLAENVILLTYRSRRAGRTAIRSSLWRRCDGGPWRALFHQGTLQPEGLA